MLEIFKLLGIFLYFSLVKFAQKAPHTLKIELFKTLIRTNLIFIINFTTTVVQKIASLINILHL